MPQPQRMWMFALTPVAAGIVSLGGTAVDCRP